ncbi:hypothetical protein [Streptomyces sp. NPDC058279]|uniref:hypothetical protein n=1 Tax=Streptomyces sp. NPDC058279 TaxID=3346418 RepID=UPI0036EAF0C0
MPQATLALTDDRRRCTGESHQALHALLTDTDQPLTIPTARHPEQAQLEAAVFLACCKIGSLSEHPWASSRCVLRKTGSPFGSSTSRTSSTTGPSSSSPA